MERLVCAAFAACVITALPALAQDNCAARNTVIGQLESSYGEAFSGGGLQSTERIFEVWISEDKGTWTIIMTHANGTTCVMASGTDWREALPAAQQPKGIPG